MRMGDGGGGKEREEERRVRGLPRVVSRGLGFPGEAGVEGERFPADRGLGGGWRRERHDYCYYY